VARPLFAVWAKTLELLPGGDELRDLPGVGVLVENVQRLAAGTDGGSHDRDDLAVPLVRFFDRVLPDLPD